jgi:NAD(P) transhydrogenase subunit alpha
MDLEAAGAEDAGGYARQMDEAFYNRQRELMSDAVAQSDVVITTAAVPGKLAPKLVTAEMVGGMAPGSVIVDLAAERGGNCELTRPGETVSRDGVTILGPTNLASEKPYHASRLYAKNIATFFEHLVKEGTEEGRLSAALEDQILRETLVARDGRVVCARVCELLGIDPPAAPEAGGASVETDAKNTAAEPEEGNT